jgi:hypothetical protein
VIGTGIAMLAVAQVTAIDIACANALTKDELRVSGPVLADYSDRRGFPKPPEQMTGAALADFQMPSDFRTPPALRPWTDDTRPVPYG